MLLKSIDSEEFIELQLYEKLWTVRTNVWIVIPLFGARITPVSVNGNLHWLYAHQTVWETIEYHSWS